VALNNIFAGRSAIRGRKQSPQSVCDYNLLSTEEDVREPHGIVGKPEFVAPEAGLFALRQESKAIGGGRTVDNFAPGTGSRVDMGAIPFGSDLVLPERPIPVYLDRYQMEFSPQEVKAGAHRPVVATVKGEGFLSPYRIAQNEAFDWFTVTPQQGLLRSGESITFEVKVLPEKMRTRQIYRGAFLVRLANGYSRPVTVYARTDYVPPVKPESGGEFVAYVEGEEPAGGAGYEVVPDAGASGGRCVLVAGNAGRQPAEYRFSVPTDGSYVVLMRVRSEEPVAMHDSLYFSIDDGKMDQATLRSDTAWRWSMVAHNRQQSLTCLEPFRLKAGEHLLRVAPRESLFLDLIAVTPNPALFW